MDSTEQLIASLSESAAPARKASQPFVLFTGWFAGCIGYVAVILCFMGLRDDLMLKLHTPVFLLEIVLLLLTVMATGTSAVLLSYPDLHQKRPLAFAPVLPLLAFWGLLATQWFDCHCISCCLSLVAWQPVHGAECLMCITFMSLLPAAALLLILRRLASVHYYMAGMVAVIAAWGVGALALRLSEKTDSVAHLVQWHYLPMLGFAIAGLVLGRKFLKW